MRKLFIFVLFGLFCFLCVSVSADVVHMKSGKKWEGKILDETDKEVTINIGTIKMKLKKADIKSIERKSVEEKGAKEEKEEGEKKEGKEEKAEEKDSGRASTIPPPPKKEDIWGYQLNSWDTPPAKIKGVEGQRDKAEKAAYFSVLDPPEDVASLIPEEYTPPADVFTNLYFFRSGDYPQYKTRFFFYKDKLYAIQGKIAVDMIGLEINYAEWVEERRKELGGETERKDDGTMTWDSEGGYAKFTPMLKKGGAPAPTDAVMEYDIVLYSKKARQEILDWVKNNLKK